MAMDTSSLTTIISVIVALAGSMAGALSLVYRQFTDQVKRTEEAANAREKEYRESTAAERKRLDDSVRQCRELTERVILANTQAMEAMRPIFEKALSILEEEETAVFTARERDRERERERERRHSEQTEKRDGSRAHWPKMTTPIPENNHK
jgi:hypothetical protein